MLWIAWIIALTASPVNLILRKAGAGTGAQMIHVVICVVSFISVIVYFVKNR